MPLAEETNEEFTRVYGEIRAHFTVTQIPKGSASEEIRREWVGLDLPVRAKFLGEEALKETTYFDTLSGDVIKNTESVTVVGVDAIVALDDAGKEEASDYWAPFAFATFVFRASEGVLTPVVASHEETEKPGKGQPLERYFAVLNCQSFGSRNDFERAVIDQVVNPNKANLPIGFSYKDAIEGAIRRRWLKVNREIAGVTVEIPKAEDLADADLARQRRDSPTKAYLDYEEIIEEFSYNSNDLIERAACNH
jgi:hypothetical protein